MDVLEPLPDDAFVVRGGRVPFRKSLTEGCEAHPATGHHGFSVQSAPGRTVQELASKLPHRDVGFTTVGSIREAGYDVIRTPGRGGRRGACGNLRGCQERFALEVAMKTIDVDFNAIDEEDRVRLTTRVAERSLAASGIVPGDWAWLTDGEIRVGALVRLDASGNLVAKPAWETRVDREPDVGLELDGVWPELRGLLDDGDRSRQGEARLLQLLTWVEELTLFEARDQLKPGYFPYRRAGALWALGLAELSRSELGLALEHNSSDPAYLAFDLELQRILDLGAAVARAESLVADPKTPALVLAGCINVLATSSDPLPDREFPAQGQKLLDWAARFDTAPGHANVAASVVVQVLFNRWMALLRLAEVHAAREFLQAIIRLDPNNRSAREAIALDSYNHRARELASLIRSRATAA